MEHLPDLKQQLEKVRELFTTRIAPFEMQKQYVDFTLFITIAQKAIEHTYYPQRRGLNKETIERFKLGYYDASHDQQHIITALMGYDPITQPALIIPYPGTGYYIARLIEPNGEHKYSKPVTDKAGPEPIFNLEDLYNNEGYAVFITEGQLDALSIIQAGGKAVAIGGQGQHRIIKLLKEKFTENPILIAWDNDPVGMKKGLEFEAGKGRIGPIGLMGLIGHIKAKRKERKRESPSC